MNEQQTKLDVELCNISGEGCLKFTFCDNFTEEDAKFASQEWEELVSTKKDGKINLVWNCLNMKSYEQKALSTWNQTLKKYKGHIGQIWLVTDSKMLKAGAMMISAFTNLKIKVVKSLDMIKYE